MFFAKKTYATSCDSKRRQAHEALKAALDRAVADATAAGLHPRDIAKELTGRATDLHMNWALTASLGQAWQ